jgi:hypothetical protein
MDVYKNILMYALIYPKDNSKKTQARLLLQKYRIDFQKVFCIINNLSNGIIPKLEHLGCEIIEIAGCEASPKNDLADLFLAKLFDLMDEKMEFSTPRTKEDDKLVTEIFNYLNQRSLIQNE